MELLELIYFILKSIIEKILYLQLLPVICFSKNLDSENAALFWKKTFLLSTQSLNYRMCEGEKRKLVIPPDMGYGDRGAPPKIPRECYIQRKNSLSYIKPRPSHTVSECL